MRINEPFWQEVWMKKWMFLGWMALMASSAMATVRLVLMANWAEGLTYVLLMDGDTLLRHNHMALRLTDGKGQGVFLA